MTGKKRNRMQWRRNYLQPLEKQFDCPFCSRGKSCDVKLVRWKDGQVGTVTCGICGVRWQTTIHNLAEAIDVYSAWIDACELANKSS